MASRINISIREDLHARIQEVKEFINISQICQEALEQAVNRLVFRQQTIEDPEKLAERIVQEKMGNFKKWFNKGFNEGLGHAQTSYSYDDFMQIINKDIIPLEDDYWRMDEEETGFDYEAVEKGYKSGVLKVWGQIEGKVKQAVKAAIQEFEFEKSYKFLEEGTKEWHKIWGDAMKQIRSDFPDEWEDMLDHLHYMGYGWQVGYHGFRIKNYTSKSGDLINLSFQVPIRPLD